MSTPYHAAYFAHELTRRSPSDSIAKLGSSLFNATVDLNPHQLDAALFSFRSPLTRGVILADEVGLGKTIEAALVVSQLWAERKRRVLVIAPAILRKQWSQELADKFFLNSVVMDSKEFNAAKKAGQSPFEPRDKVVIASYHFAAARKHEVAHIPWNLVIIDEAHRLRNVYKPKNKIANAIKDAVQGRQLLLLTATPLQNDLLELYGLVSVLDDHIFGDLDTFKARYKRGSVEERQLDDLRSRLKTVCQRTLRRQVTEYVRFTNRIPFSQDFTPTAEEQRLYDLVSAYLQRNSLNALPPGQRKLMTLVLRKLLASSTFAIAGTLYALAKRLEIQGKQKTDDPTPDVQDDFESYAELADEWDDDEGTEATEIPEENTPPQSPASLQDEIAELRSYGNLASSIVLNAKGEALLTALKHGFDQMAQLGAARKAVIFTESRRTQAYLINLLDANGYVGRVLTINGVNADDRSGKIYKAWLKRHEGEVVVTGNKTVDLRAALVEHFRDHADILIATEAAAEGVNLQFCSLVVNYDLPWNPQRIEQRIGRCHRYGQKHDVVVINFLNRNNAADQRVFELLSEKFKLFHGVFGSSDEVLGTLESGVDFERRIAEIYQTCRTPDEIDHAFQALRAELEEQIAVRMTDTRQKLLENFDDEVQQKLRINYEASRSFLGRMERWLWELTRHELDGSAAFHDETLEFDLTAVPAGCPPVPTGRYRFVTRQQESEGTFSYRLGHPLAEMAVQGAKERNLPPARVVFDYGRHGGKIGLVKNLVGRSGWLRTVRLTIQALDEEEHLLLVAVDDDGNAVHPEVCEKLFLVRGTMSPCQSPPQDVEQSIDADVEQRKTAKMTEIGKRNNRFFEEEIDKLDRWVDDLKNGLETEIKDLNAVIKQVGKDAKLAPDLKTKLELQKKKKDLESQRSRKQRELFEAQDEIESRKDSLISDIEARLQQKVEITELFTIRWEVR